MKHEGSPTRKVFRLDLTQEKLDVLHEVLGLYITATTACGRVPVNDGHPFHRLRLAADKDSYMHGFHDALCLHAEQVDTGNEIEYRIKGVPVYDIFRVVRTILSASPYCFGCKYAKELSGETVKIRCSHKNPQATASNLQDFPQSFNPLTVGRCDSAEYPIDEKIVKRYYSTAPKVQTAGKPRSRGNAPATKYRSYRPRSRRSKAK